MRVTEDFQREWNAAARPFFRSLTIVDGLVLGTGTVVARMTHRHGVPAPAVEGEEERILALRSLGFRQAIPTITLKFLKRAANQWARGEKAVAHFELAFARLPRFETREDARTLSCAAALIKQGVSPRWLGAYIGNCCRRLPNGAQVRIKVRN